MLWILLSNWYDTSLNNLYVTIFVSYKYFWVIILSSLKIEVRTLIWWKLWVSAICLSGCPDLFYIDLSSMSIGFKVDWNNLSAAHNWTSVEKYYFLSLILFLEFGCESVSRKLKWMNFWVTVK